MSHLGFDCYFDSFALLFSRLDVVSGLGKNYLTIEFFKIIVAPNEKMAEILKKTSKEAKDMISKVC